MTDSQQVGQAVGAGESALLLTTDEEVNKNLEMQKDELEALGAIYGVDFTMEDSTTSTFSIVIHIGDKEGEEATLVISYTNHYPSRSPPVYQLSIPWIRGEEKRTILDVLDKLYRYSNGESVIVYVWVEKLRELLTKNPGADLLAPLPATAEDGKGESISLLQQVANFTGSEINANANRIPVPVIATGEPLTDRKSTFQAHVAAVNSVQDVKLVLAELLKNKKIASATHNMYAYLISIPGGTGTDNKNSGSGRWIQDCDDDGETHAGGRLLHLLQILECQNVVVVVTRWYGGVMLYGDRFKHINNVARQLLGENGFIKSASGGGGGGGGGGGAAGLRLGCQK